MLGGRSDESSILLPNSETVDGINVMQLNQMGDLVGEDSEAVYRMLYSFCSQLNFRPPTIELFCLLLLYFEFTTIFFLTLNLMFYFN